MYNETLGLGYTTVSCNEELSESLRNESKRIVAVTGSNYK